MIKKEKARHQLSAAAQKYLTSEVTWTIRRVDQLRVIGAGWGGQIS